MHLYLFSVTFRSVGYSLLGQVQVNFPSVFLQFPRLQTSGSTHSFVSAKTVLKIKLRCKKVNYVFIYYMYIIHAKTFFFILLGLLYISNNLFKHSIYDTELEKNLQRKTKFMCKKKHVNYR